MPLIAVPAAALDTETTGLDIRRARLIEIAILRVEGGQILADGRLDELVDCGEPIPAKASAIHGITADMLAGRPRFADLHGRIRAAIADRVVVGHTIGFDLALLKQECKRAGLEPLQAPVLDIRILAQIVQRDLASYSLEGLASWLGVSSENRHRAGSDATMAGAVFCALVPLLREAGIRTLGEALARSRHVTDAMSGTVPVEWQTDNRLSQLAEDTRSLDRLDSYPYRHRIREVMNTAPVVLPPATPLAAALGNLAALRLSSVLVGDSLAHAGALAILTERDVLRALADAGGAALDQPIGPFATRPVITVPDDALIYRAIGRMTNRRIRHLVVVGSDDSVVGIVTTRDLLKFRADSAIALDDAIDTAETVTDLARAFARLTAMARALLGEAVPARQIAGVVAHEISILTRRAAEMAEAELASGPLGAAPCPYAIIVLGSAGRGESMLAMDQDNAVIFAEGDPDSPQDRWFAAHGEVMCRILHEVGVPLCKGGVMASKPAFRGSLATWRTRVAGWLNRARPEDLLAVDILFDFRAVHGRRSLASTLWQEAWRAVDGQSAFLRLLAAHAGETDNHLTLLGGIRTGDDGRIDLKVALLKGLVTATRVLSLKHGEALHGTAERLTALGRRGVVSSGDLALINADHELAMRLILNQQLHDAEAGTPPGNRVAVKTLSATDRSALKAALGRQSTVAAMLASALSG